MCGFLNSKQAVQALGEERKRRTIFATVEIRDRGKERKQTSGVYCTEDHQSALKMRSRKLRLSRKARLLYGISLSLCAAASLCCFPRIRKEKTLSQPNVSNTGSLYIDHALEEYTSALCKNPETNLCPGKSGKLGKRCRGDLNMMWSIGKGEGDDVFDLIVSGPIQSGEDAGRTSLFVADPFLVVEGERWFVFSEVLNAHCQKGEIGYHTSFDSGKTWSFGQVVLREPWHLSFPFVVLHEGEYFMTTCPTAGTTKPYTLWLYSTRHFPRGWRRRVKLLQEGQLFGRPVDPVLLQHDGLWFLFVLDDELQKERLFFSRSLFGPYTEHTKSQSYLLRQSGKIITGDDGNLWAFHHTGSIVERWHLRELSADKYQYAESIPLLGPRKDKWAESGMHTFNAVKLDSGKWVAVVDGWWDDNNWSSFDCFERVQDCKHVASKSNRYSVRQQPSNQGLRMQELNQLTAIQKEFGFVFVQLVNSAYLRMVLNWVCNAPPGVLEQTVFFATDVLTERVLNTYVPRIIPNVILYPYESPELTYGNRNYYYFMAFRLRLMEQIIASGVSIWLVESDSTWFEHPGWVLQEYTDQDVLAGQDGLLTDSIPEAGNMFLNASSDSTLTLLTNLRKEQEWSLWKLADGEVGNNGNEMLMLPRHLNKLRWTFLPRKLFVGGLWYKNETFRNSVTPLVIQNNWVIGNHAKVQRAKNWGHWYLLDDLTCAEM